MGIRTNSEKNMTHSMFKLKIGTTNKNKPEIIYYEGRAFIKPNEYFENYSREISEIKRKFQQDIKNNDIVNKYFTQQYILDFKIAKNGISPEKKSFLTFQLLFRQKNNKELLKLNDAKKLTNNMMESLLSSLTNEIERRNFSISKTKS